MSCGGACYHFDMDIFEPLQTYWSGSFFGNNTAASGGNALKTAAYSLFFTPSCKAAKRSVLLVASYINLGVRYALRLSSLAWFSNNRYAGGGGIITFFELYEKISLPSFCAIPGCLQLFYPSNQDKKDHSNIVSQ